MLLPRVRYGSRYWKVFLLGICALSLAGPCDGAGNCKAVDLRDITLTIENSSRLDSGSFSGSFHLFLHGLRV